MMVRRAVLAGLTAVLAGWPAGAAAQALTGRVFDGTTGAAVAAVRVVVLTEAGQSAAIAVSDSTGTFHTRLPGAGTFRLSATAVGYDSLTVDSVTVAPQQEVRVELRLGPRPLDVQGLTVVARRAVGPPALQDYYRRLDHYNKAGAGLGLVLDQETLDRHPGQTGARALAQEGALVVREPTKGPGSGIVVRRARQRFGQGQWCTPAMFLDGLLVDAATLQSMPTSSLAGIEMYRGIAEVPAEYTWAPGAEDCGVVLAWTRPNTGRHIVDPLRPLRYGGYVAQGNAGGLDVGGYGVELEKGLLSSTAAWLEAGATPAVPCAAADSTCVETASPWNVMVGATVFPTGEDLVVSPYVGAGAGLGNPSGAVDVVSVFRVGLEFGSGRLRIRAELRRGTAGRWGIGLGALF